MLMLKALRHSPIRRLWLSQATSSIGDEIYRVGLTWLAVGLIGADTGYLNAAQAATLMTLSFIGGKWADHWDPLRTMIRVDLVRAWIVLVPVVYSFFAPAPLALLAVVAIALSGLGAFFDPALQTVLPAFSPNREIQQAATGLMMTTIRMARMIGPALVGFLAGVIPPIHFFTMDAISFFFSAGSLAPLQNKSTLRRERKRITFSEAVLTGFQLLRTSPGMEFILFAKALTAGTWNLVYGLGLALLVQELAARDTRSFGFVIAAYGVGNFAGALYFGNRARRRPATMMYVGFVWLGLGFIWISLAPTISWVMLAAAVAGFSGTMNEVTFFDLVQARFPLTDMIKIFRLRMATDTLVTLVLLLWAPMLFRLMGVRSVIAVAGIVWILIGALGWLRFRAPFAEKF